MYELHLAAGRTNKEKLRDQATRALRGLYGGESAVSVVFEEAIAPEGSGKYLISKTLFPIEVEDYLDKKACSGKEEKLS